MKTLLSLLGILLFTTPQARATTLVLKSGEVRYEVEIKTLGIGSGTIVGKNKELMAVVETGDGGIQGGMIVPVVKFESNNTRRDRDVAKILDYENHPAIVFEVVEISAADIERTLTESEGKIPLRGKLSVAGGSKVYDMVINFTRNGDELRCSTAIEAKFSDFGMEPPTFGLILKSAPDEILLSGELVFDIKNE